MKRRLNEMSTLLKFFGTGMRRFHQTASLVPSSRFLVRALLEALPLAHARCVVELGPGVGTVTKELLARLPPDAHVHAIELDASLLEEMGRGLHDDRLRAIHGSATDAAALVRHDGCRLGADVVISSLGLSMMPTPMREEVLGAVSDLLLPGGKFVQYQYAHSRAMSFQPGEGFHAFDGPQFLSRWFNEIETSFVTLNVPPAFVYTCSGARALAPRSTRPKPRLRLVGTR